MKRPDDMITKMNSLGYFTADQLSAELGVSTSKIYEHSWPEEKATRIGGFRFFNRDEARRQFSPRPIAVTVKPQAPRQADVAAILEMALDTMSKLEASVSELTKEIARLHLRLDRDDGVKIAEAERQEELAARREGNGRSNGNVHSF